MIEYVGGIKKKNFQVCLSCGFTSKNILDFVSNSHKSDPALVIEELCTRCEALEKNYSWETY